MPDPPVTIRDVAAAARVHPATASRALNPETRVLVSEKTARRVLRAAKSLRYRPNPMARTLRTLAADPVVAAGLAKLAPPIDSITIASQVHHP